MEITRSIPALRERLTARRAGGETLGLVPTMGGLHEGHASLVAAARAAGDLPVATIFLNPTQFGPGEDLGSYPQAVEADLELLREAGTGLVFLPPVVEIYPPGFATRVAVERYNDILCAQMRPGHFDGVTLVVTKLLNIGQADRAYFGEKDWQQLQIVRALSRDLNFPTEIVGCPTARAKDGLALSTRNKYLSAAERKVAARLYAEITAAAERIAEGEPTELACADAQENLILAGFQQIEYLECRHGESLRLAPSPGEGARVFVAARLGEARLIDNVAVPG